jgi:hypothetical protein
VGTYPYIVESKIKNHRHIAATNLGFGLGDRPAGETYSPDMRSVNAEMDITPN